ncbi:MAG TPA: hypothetical protein DEH78_33295 [Solibacterales bacterium]|nr:hypothetical protein [Bryobacterales bacterium]
MKTIALLVSLGTLAPAAPGTVFRKVFTGLTSSQASSALPNIGQGMHMLTVMFPAASGDVTGIVVRLEASYDGSSYFPITQDVATATYTGSMAYAITRGNGTFPFVRVNVATASGSNPMTVYYTGSTHPLGNVILDSGRYLVEGPSQISAGRGPLYRVDAVPTSGWTLLNAGSSPVLQLSNGLGVLQADASGGIGTNNMRIAYRTITAGADFTVEAFLKMDSSTNVGNDCGWGITVQNSANSRLVNWGVQGTACQNDLYRRRYTSPTAFSAGCLAVGGFTGQQCKYLGCWMRVQRVGDALKFSYSFNRELWKEAAVCQESVAAFIGQIDRVGVYFEDQLSNPASGLRPALWIGSFSLTTP